MERFRTKDYNTTSRKINEIIASVFFFVLESFLIILFLVGSYEFAKDYGRSNFVSQILLNWAISLVLFTIIIVYIVRVYSFKSYNTMSPEEWLLSFENYKNFNPSKFVLRNGGRTYLIDENKFTLVSLFEFTRIVSYSIFFLVSSFNISCYPFFQQLLTSYSLNYLLHDPVFIIMFLTMFGILLLPVPLLIFSYKSELAWKFEKEPKDVLSLTLSNHSKKKFHARINNLDISDLPIIETDRETLFPDLNPGFISNTKPIYVLFIKFSDFLQDEIDIFDQYHLFIGYSREETDLMKKIFLMWINN